MREHADLQWYALALGFFRSWLGARSNTFLGKTHPTKTHAAV